MATQNQENPSLITSIHVNYYVVYNPDNKSIIYTGTEDQCQTYIRNTELDHCQVWHFHDIEFHSKPVYIHSQE
jgi:archaellum component FlaG (FlaF/FlaG flagellin family)